MRLPLLGLSLCLWAASAQAQIYRCENTNGVVEYSNAVTEKDKDCRQVSLPTITSIPAPKLPARATSGSSGTQTANASPASFPKVDPATQKARDNDRRRILEDELAKEETRLAEIRKEYNNGEPERRGDERNYQRYLDRVQRLKEDIERSEGNISSLKRELGAIQ